MKSNLSCGVRASGFFILLLLVVFMTSSRFGIAATSTLPWDHSAGVGGAPLALGGGLGTPSDQLNDRGSAGSDEEFASVKGEGQVESQNGDGQGHDPGADLGGKDSDLEGSTHEKAQKSSGPSPSGPKSENDGHVTDPVSLVKRDVLARGPHKFVDTAANGAVIVGGETGAVVVNYETKTKTPSVIHQIHENFSSLAISRDGHFVIGTTAQRVDEYQHHSPSKATLYSVARMEPKQIAAVLRHDFTCAAFSPDGRTAYLGTSDGLIYRWNNPHSGDGKLARILEIAESSSPIISLHVSAGQIAAGSQSGKAAMWSLADHQVLLHYSGAAVPIEQIRILGRTNRIFVKEGSRFKVLRNDKDRMWSDLDITVPTSWFNSHVAMSVSWDEAFVIAANGIEVSFYGLDDGAFLGKISRPPSDHLVGNYSGIREIVSTPDANKVVIQSFPDAYSAYLGRFVESYSPRTEVMTLPKEFVKGLEGG